MTAEKLFKKPRLYLELENVGPFDSKSVSLTRNGKDKIVIYWKNAKGKTTVARTLYAFLTGYVDVALLKEGAEKGKVVLIFNEKEYRLEISKSSAHVDKVFDAPYAEYLVLTEGTPLYSFYVSPPKQVDLDELVKRFVPQTLEMLKLEAELKKLEKSYDIDELIKTHQMAIEEKQRELEKLEEELRKIDEKLSKAVDMEKVKPIFEKQKLQDQIRKLEERLKTLEEAYAELSTELGAIDYEELKRRQRELADKIETLRHEKDAVEKLRQAYEDLKKALQTIRDNIWVFDRDTVDDEEIRRIKNAGLLLGSELLDEEKVEDIIRSSIDTGIDMLKSYYERLEKLLSEAESEKKRIEATLSKHVEKYKDLEKIGSEISKLKKELADARYRLSMVEREVRELEQELGMSEDEIVKKVLESQDAGRLMARRNELMRRIENVKTIIRDLEAAIERSLKMRDEVLEAWQKYNELKKKYNAMKNEWTKKKKIFRKTFKQVFREVLMKNVGISHYNVETMSMIRVPHTYSQGERLLLTIAYQYALVSALKAAGYDIPMVVIDLPAPLDNESLMKVLRIYEKENYPVIVMATAANVRDQEIYTFDEFAKKILLQ